MGQSRPVSSAGILVPVRGVSPGSRQPATAKAQCKDSACSGTRLQEEQGLVDARRLNTVLRPPQFCLNSLSRLNSAARTSPWQVWCGLHSRTALSALSKRTGWCRHPWWQVQSWPLLHPYPSIGRVAIARCFQIHNRCSLSTKESV